MSRQYKTGQADLEKLDGLILKKTKEDTKPISYRLWNSVSNFYSEIWVVCDVRSETTW